MRAKSKTLEFPPSRREKAREKKTAEKPVSLAPLSFEEAVANLVKVKPGKSRGRRSDD